MPFYNSPAVPFSSINLSLETMQRMPNAESEVRVVEESGRSARCSAGFGKTDRFAFYENPNVRSEMIGGGILHKRTYVGTSYVGFYAVVVDCLRSATEILYLYTYTTTK